MDSEVDPSLLLRVQGVRVQFPGVLALDGVDFGLRAGEVHALMGENGAGKSTLIKVITGVHSPDAGLISLEGKVISPRNPAGAQRLGISSVFQEVNLIPSLSVAENVVLGKQPMRGGRIDWRRVHRRAEEALSRLNVTLDTRQILETCPIAIQQLVAIARALDVAEGAAAAKVLVLDEPTSSLDRDEVRRLFEVIRRLRTEGLGIVFISHFLDQVYEISDRITVLRNGRLIGVSATSELPPIELISMMLGREAPAGATTSQARTSREVAEPILSASGLTRRDLGPVDLAVGRGEVVGLAGLLGSGRTEVARLLFGLDRRDGGQVKIEGKESKIGSPRQGMAAGIGFLPEDRKTEGIMPSLSVRENIILAMQVRAGWYRRISRRKQEEIAAKYIKALRIATPSAESAVGQLSGGNQQKVMIARWLAAQPRVLILDEPTRGVDVGAKAEIEALMSELCGDGLAIVLIGTDLEEVARDSHRIVVMRDRKKVGELSGEDIQIPRIMQMIAQEAPSHA